MLSLSYPVSNKRSHTEVFPKEVVFFTQLRLRISQSGFGRRRVNIEGWLGSAVSYLGLWQSAAGAASYTVVEHAPSPGLLQTVLGGATDDPPQTPMWAADPSVWALVSKSKG